METESIEIWADMPIPALKGRYKVSSYGNICAIQYNGKTCAPRPLKRGRSQRLTTVRMYDAQKRKYIMSVGRAVLLAFVGEPPPGTECSHKDGNQEHNRLENLCWETHAENMQRKHEHGTVLRGESSPISKLTKPLVLEARHRYANGEGATAIARTMGVTEKAIRKVVQRESWQHV